MACLRHGTDLRHVKARNVLGTLIKKQKPGPAEHGTENLSTAREHGTVFYTAQHGTVFFKQRARHGTARKPLQHTTRHGTAPDKNSAREGMERLGTAR